MSERPRTAGIIPKLAAGLALAGMVALVGPWVEFARRFGWDYSDTAVRWGQFGDFVGGVGGTIVAFLALVALAVSIWVQHQTLQATLHELERTLASFDEQRQEDLFYRMTAALEGVLSGIQHQDVVGRAALERSLDQLRHSMGLVNVYTTTPSAAARSNMHTNFWIWWRNLGREAPQRYIDSVCEILRTAIAQRALNTPRWRFFLATLSDAERLLLLSYAAFSEAGSDLRELMRTAGLGSDDRWSQLVSGKAGELIQESLAAEETPAAPDEREATAAS